jgi:hypothetical protein
MPRFDEKAKGRFDRRGAGVALRTGVRCRGPGIGTPDAVLSRCSGPLGTVHESDHLIEQHGINGGEIVAKPEERSAQFEMTLAATGSAAFAVLEWFQVRQAPLYARDCYFRLRLLPTRCQIVITADK